MKCLPKKTLRKKGDKEQFDNALHAYEFMKKNENKNNPKHNTAHKEKAIAKTFGNSVNM